MHIFRGKLHFQNYMN